MGNTCTSVVKRVWGDRKCPMASGTNCEVEYRVDEDWMLFNDSEGSLRLFLTDNMTETKPENLEMIDQSQPLFVFLEIQVPSKYMRPLCNSDLLWFHITSQATTSTSTCLNNP